MKALILNSGMGSRMEAMTLARPKCMTEIDSSDTILSRQLKAIAAVGLTDVVMTVGYLADMLEQYCDSLKLPLQYTFVTNPCYKTTNYIYSIYCARTSLDCDLILMHGDLVFEEAMLLRLLSSQQSCMAVSSTLPLPEKDFKAVVKDGWVRQIGIDLFTNALAAQPLYKLNQQDWAVWMERICKFCEVGNVGCYAENAFNEVSELCHIAPFNFGDALCAEVDTIRDLYQVANQLSRSV